MDGLLLTGETVVTSETIMAILSAVTGTFSVTQIVAMIAGIIGVSITFVFLWWGVRKGAKSVMAAVKSGKFRI